MTTRYLPRMGFKLVQELHVPIGRVHPYRSILRTGGESSVEVAQLRYFMLAPQLHGIEESESVRTHVEQIKTSVLSTDTQVIEPDIDGDVHTQDRSVELQLQKFFVGSQIVHTYSFILTSREEIFVGHGNVDYRPPVDRLLDDDSVRTWIEYSNFFIVAARVQ